MCTNCGRHKENCIIQLKLHVKVTEIEQVTDYIEQRPSWGANSHSASQEISRFLQNPKVHYRLHKSPPMVPILSKMHQLYNFPLCFLKTHTDIFPSTPTSCEWFLPFRFTDNNFLCISHLCHACYMSHPSHPPPFDHANNISWRVMQTSPTSRQFLPLKSKNARIFFAFFCV
jgi:hypothetical protein